MSDGRSNRRSKRVVVTGASGNVGVALLRRLSASGGDYHVTALARNPPSSAGLVGNGEMPVDWKTVDVCRDDLVGLFRGADAIVHLAWRFHPTRDVRQTWRDNVLGSERTFAAAVRADVPALVYASSVGAYSPGPQTTGELDVPVDENWPTHALPTAAYGRQKSYVERLLDVCESQADLRIVRIRSAFVFQRQAAPEQRRIFAGPFLPGRLLGKFPVLPLPRGLRIQTVAADDLAAAYEAAIAEPVRGAFNIAAEPVLDADGLADAFGARVVEVPRSAARAALAAAFHTRLVPAEPGLLELALSLPLMDTTRARVELGWEPAASAKEALRAFLDGLADPQGGPTPRLDANAGGPLRVGELASGVGARE
jgi:nucleoside-diphosphate-sugar epimerase